MIDKGKRIGTYQSKLCRIRAAGLGICADPVKLIRQSPPDTGLCHVFGIVPKTSAVKITENDFLFLDREGVTELPEKPDHSLMKCKPAL